MPLTTVMALPAGASALVMVIAIGVLFYFMMIRPMRRQQAKQAELVNSLAPDSRVLLNSGMYGTIRHVGAKQAVVELAPGLEVTVLKGAIARVAAADEEEFEYADDVDAIEELPVTTEVPAEVPVGGALVDPEPQENRGQQQ